MRERGRFRDGARPKAEPPRGRRRAGTPARGAARGNESTDASRREGEPRARREHARRERRDERGANIYRLCLIPAVRVVIRSAYIPGPCILSIRIVICVSIYRVRKRPPPAGLTK